MLLIIHIVLMINSVVVVDYDDSGIEKMMIELKGI